MYVKSNKKEKDYESRRSSEKQKRSSEKSISFNG
jgi:hypothetical protein